MIAEVNNTFDERRMYLLDDTLSNSTVNADRGKSSRKFRHSWQKDFHVSPFNSRKGSYKLSAADLFNPDGLQGAAAVDVKAILNSSKGRPKLVARLVSTAVPLDPAKVSKFRALNFLISWSLVGWMTCMCDSRLVFQRPFLLQSDKLTRFPLWRSSYSFRSHHARSQTLFRHILPART
jgi:hypothetical protein